jgi:hypothetical protein
MFGTSVSVLVAIASLAVQAQDPPEAQAPPKRMTFLQGYVGMGLNPGRYALIGVCRYPEVQEELKMTEAQKKKFVELDAKAIRDGRRITDDFSKKVKELEPEADPETRSALRESEKTARTARLAESEAALRKVLDRGQFARLEQIRYQAEGTQVFTRPEVQERLFLEPEQVRQILLIAQEGDHELHQASLVPTEVMPADPQSLTTAQRRKKLESKEYQGEVKTFRKTAVTLRGQTMKKIAKVLSSGQRARFEKLVGEHFDFSKTWNKPAPQVPVVSEPETKATQPPAGK